MHEPLEQGLRRDRLDVRGDFHTSGNEHRLPMRRIYYKTRVPASKSSLTQQLESKRCPELVLVEIAAAFPREGTADIDLRLRIKRVAVDGVEDVLRHL